MARFDVYRLKSGGLVLDLQSSIIDHLWLGHESRRALVTRMLGTISIREIAETVVDLSSSDHVIIAATDFLFQGF